MNLSHDKHHFPPYYSRIRVKSKQFQFFKMIFSQKKKKMKYVSRMNLFPTSMSGEKCKIPFWPMKKTKELEIH